MTIKLSTPGVGGLNDAVRSLRDWQHDAAPMQLHPGDLGWFWKLGADATAAAVRTWNRDGRMLTVGLLDDPGLLRLAIAPEAQRDEGLAHQLIADVGGPERGVLPAGRVSVETPQGAVVQDLLLDEVGWNADEPWTPLRRDLTEPVTGPDMRIEVIGPDQAPAYTAVHRSSFGSPKLTDARCLLAYDDRGNAVAEVTVWSAGAGRPGLLEPMGVHADHRGRGYGKAICVAAAAALQGLGSSSAMVCTPSANVAAIATYESAGFQPLPVRRDRARNT